MEDWTDDDPTIQAVTDELVELELTDDINHQLVVLLALQVEIEHRIKQITRE